MSLVKVLDPGIKNVLAAFIFILYKTGFQMQLMYVVVIALPLVVYRVKRVRTH